MESHSTMALLLLLVITDSAAAAVTGAPDGLSRPWLTVDRGVKLLNLTCKPPPQSSSWGAVYDLRLTHLLKHQSVVFNVSLVTVTPLMDKPKVNAGVIKTYDVSFQGTWKSKDVALNFLFPVSGKELGRYFCTVGHDDHNRQSRNFTTGLTVDQAFLDSIHAAAQPGTIGNDDFRASVIDVHQVNLTWTKPERAKLKEAFVSRSMVDDATGNGLWSPTTLFTTNGVRDFVYGDQDVLITRVNPEDSGNFSLTLYVKAKMEGSYRYSCNVPYPHCTGSRAVLCTCCVSAPDPDPDRLKCPVSQVSLSPVSQAYLGAFVVFLILFLLVVIVVLLVYCLYKKNDKCSKNPCLRKFFAPKRESGSGDEKKRLNDTKDTEELNSSSVSPTTGIEDTNIAETLPANGHSDSENTSKTKTEEMPSGVNSMIVDSSGQSSHSGRSPVQIKTGETVEEMPSVVNTKMGQGGEAAAAAAPPLQQPLQASINSGRFSTSSHDPTDADSFIRQGENGERLNANRIGFVPPTNQEDYTVRDCTPGAGLLQGGERPSINNSDVRHYSGRSKSAPERFNV